MLSASEIRAAVDAAIDSYGHPERKFTVRITIGLANIFIEITGLSSVKFDKEPDPQIQKDPVQEFIQMTEIIPIVCNERVIRAFVRAMIEEMELIPIKYE